MNIDLFAFINVAAILAAIFGLIGFVTGIVTIQNANKLPYFRFRRQKLLNGWRQIFLGVGMGFFSILLATMGKPIATSFIPVTATPSLSPTPSVTSTITQTPTITVTPTITETPLVSNTPTNSPTPYVPMAILAQFEGRITPNPETQISTPEFSQRLNKDYTAVRPSTEFQNPVGHMFAVFSYDGMALGSQWTAVWYRDGELVHYESKPWLDGTGGSGYSDWNPEPEEWLAGVYEVQIFVGMEWKAGGAFEVIGGIPTRTITPSMTPTRTNTLTVTVTNTRPPTWTVEPTITRWPTATPLTPTATITPRPWPTLTPE